MQVVVLDHQRTFELKLVQITETARLNNCILNAPSILSSPDRFRLFENESASGQRIHIA